MIGRLAPSASHSSSHTRHAKCAATIDPAISPPTFDARYERLRRVAPPRLQDAPTNLSTELPARRRPRSPFTPSAGPSGETRAGVLEDVFDLGGGLGARRAARRAAAHLLSIPVDAFADSPRALDTLVRWSKRTSFRG
ncbi:hypothetical protein BD626DRAFT_569236 [Schizophyllum amplum]|uniref:Uncharacterized protein n=1 Tax=Schizophyllum amplum TaxID=97359 RepID=A0A550CEG9_9AGAR|nr:hypothetical protein BD626DRAFT_569236 [Auriculariopsis ampla]